MIVTHGYVEPLVRYLREQGLESGAFKTEYGDDEEQKEAEASAGGDANDEPTTGGTPERAQNPGTETGTDTDTNNQADGGTPLGNAHAMKDFAALFAELDATTSTKKKTDALLAYFRRAQPADAAWALYFLAGGKPRQTVPTALVRATARECAGIPEWLFDESYDVVGDLAETVAHVLPPPQQHRSSCRCTSGSKSALLALARADA